MADQQNHFMKVCVNVATVLIENVSLIGWYLDTTKRVQRLL